MRFSNSFMHSKIVLQPDELQIVQAILRTHVPGREVRVFGSRVQGKVKPASDLDLCIMGDNRLQPTVLERLHSAFSESMLPMKVDLVEWADLKEGFRKIIETTATAIPMAS